MKKSEIIIGVDNLCFDLPKTCMKFFDRNPSINISFFLIGNFLPAAISDDLAHTVDYESICNKIKQRIIGYNCLYFPNIFLSTKEEILKFSSLISNGCLSLTLQCHNTLTKNEPLLYNIRE
jgi:hypothetical protein